MKTTIQLLDYAMKAIILIVIILMMFACEPEFIEPYETFTMPKGKHSKSFPLQSLQTDELVFHAIFDETSIYETVNSVNQFDVNKLMGFSDCNSHHHHNSARFGWAWVDESLKIYGYTYNDGIRVIEELGTVPLDESIRYSLKLTSDSYVFTLGDNPPVIMTRTKPCDIGMYYMLFPYFGGNETAPHDINIKIKIDY